MNLVLFATSSHSFEFLQYVATWLIIILMSNTVRKYRKFKLALPEWVPLLYGLACLILIPWTIFLAYLLPRKYVSRNWDVAWVGFDIFEIVLFALTAILAVKKSIWTALTSAMLSMVIIIDAWFDILTSRPGRPQFRSILEAVIIELPLAIISLYLAIAIFKHIAKD